MTTNDKQNVAHLRVYAMDEGEAWEKASIALNMSVHRLRMLWNLVSWPPASNTEGSYFFETEL